MICALLYKNSIRICREKDLFVSILKMCYKETCEKIKTQYYTLRFGLLQRMRVMEVIIKMIKRYEYV